jgi:hypothetical protein
MQKTVGLLAGLLFLGTATVFGAPQAPRCDPCNCPEPSCYECHFSCTGLNPMGSLQGKDRKLVKPAPAPQKPYTGVLVFASSLPLVAALAGITARRRALRNAK